jgi:O-antigen/teichoic acid export membrane protein
MGGSVVRGGAWQSSARVAGQVYTVVVSIVAARYLGPEGMGRLVFIVYVYTTLVAVLAAGLPIAVNRFTAELLGSGHPRAIRGIYDWARKLEALGASLGGGILVTVLLLGAEPAGAWLAAAVACSASVMQTIPNAILLGAQRWRHASAIGLVTGLAGASAKLMLLVAGHGISALLAVDAVVAIANLAVATLLVRRWLPERPPGGDPPPPPDLGARTRRYALASTALVLLTLVVLQRSEVVFLQIFSDDVQIALYSIPFSAVETLTLLPATLGIAAASAFATLFGAGAIDRMRDGFTRGTRLMLLVTIPLTAAAVTLGPDALRLAYGSEYDDAAPVLVVLVAVLPLASLMYLSTAVVQGFGRQRVPLITLGIAAVVNITLDLLLIPRHAALGGAVANASSQVVAALLLVVYAHRLVGRPRWDALSLSRIGVASAAAGLVALVAVLSLSTLWGFVVGAAVFTAVIAGLGIVLRVIPADDAQWLEHSIGTRFRGKGARVVRALSRHVAEATIVKP